MFEWLGPIGGIILVDLVLSGDNALVIGSAAAGLPRRQRWGAILLGGGGAIILRIVFAVAATLLLQLPLLQAIGGIVLLAIAIRLLWDRSHKQTSSKDASHEQTAPVKQSFLAALLTILIADVTMSLDNVLAVGALAAGDLPILVVGLLFSIILLLIGSALVSELVARLPWLLDVASLVLGWTAAQMLLEDIHLKASLWPHITWASSIVPAVVLAIILLADFYIWRHGKKQLAAASHASSHKADRVDDKHPTWSRR
jgi:YjbE family integral membrane protein